MRWPIFNENMSKTFSSLENNHSLASEFYQNKFYLQTLEGLQNLSGSKFALLLNSATTALDIIYLFISKKGFDQLICPAYTYPATYAPATRYIKNIKYIPPNNNSLCLDYSVINEYLKLEKSILTITHNWGVIDRPNLKENTWFNKEFSKKHFLIEDISHCGASLEKFSKDRIENSAQVMSLGQRKQLSVINGGVLFTDCEELYQFVVDYFLPSHPSKKNSRHIGNSRMSTVAVLLLESQLRAYKEIKQSWLLANTIAKELLGKEGIEVAVTDQFRESIFYKIPIYLEKSQLKRLKPLFIQQGIEIEEHNQASFNALRNSSPDNYGYLELTFNKLYLCDISLLVGRIFNRLKSI